MIFGTASLELSLLVVADICCLVLCAGSERSAWTHAPRNRSNVYMRAGIETAVEQGYGYKTRVCKQCKLLRSYQYLIEEWFQETLTVRSGQSRR